MYSRRDLFAIILTAMIALCFWSCAHAALPTGYYGRAVLTTPTVTGTHTDTPVLFKTAAGNFPQRDADASDIRVYSAAGNMMPHEIAELTLDSITIWFEADTLATGQTFYVYSGNDAPPTALATTATWDSAAAAYHYAGTPSQGATLSDATGNVDAVAGGNWESAHRGTGQVGTGWKNDDLRGVSVPDLNVTGDWTISTWLRPIGASTDVIAQGNPWWWFVSAQASNTNPQPSFVARYGDWNVSYAYSGCANDGTWAHYAVTFTTTPDTALTIYRNGVACTNSGIFEYGGANFGGSDISGWYELGYDIDLQGSNFNGGSAPFGLASQSYSTGGNQQDQYNGWVDEYAIYTTAFSADKVAALYASQADPAGWFTPDYQFNLTNPEPVEQVTLPTIASVSGPLNTSGAEITVTGATFGGHTMQLAPDGVGPAGWIELNDEFTDMTALVGVPRGEISTVDPINGSTTGIFQGQINGTLADTNAKITTIRAKTGTKSVSQSTAYGTDPGLSAADAEPFYSRPLAYVKADYFTEVYVSWWDYFQAVTGDPVTQRKMLTIADGKHHAQSGSLNYFWRFTADLDDYRHFYMEVYQPFGMVNPGYKEAITDSTGTTYVLRPEADRPYSHPVNYYPYNGEFAGPTRWDAYPLQNGNHWQTALPEQGTWFRWEAWAKHNSAADVNDGEFDLWLTHPDSGRIHISGIRGMTYEDGVGAGRGWFIDQDYTTAPGDSILNAHHGAFVDNYKWNMVELMSYWAALGNEAANQYADDFYVQTGTKARVEIGNKNTYDACTELHVQYPTRWWTEDGVDKITFRCNRGVFDPTDTTYLYVVNSSGQVNAQGFLMPKTRPVGGRDVDDLIGGE